MKTITLTALGVTWEYIPWLPPQDRTLGVFKPLVESVVWRGVERRLPFAVYVNEPYQSYPNVYVSCRVDSGTLTPGAYQTLLDEMDAFIQANLEAFTPSAEDIMEACLKRAHDASYPAMRAADIIREHLYLNRYKHAVQGLDDEQNAMVWNTAVDALITELTALKKEV